jgi:hypothetical protein
VPDNPVSGLEQVVDPHCRERTFKYVFNLIETKIDS